MVLTVYHMERSQSERVVFLCEELGIDYELKTFPRTEIGLAPEIFKKLHEAGTAPVIEDDTPHGKIVMSESTAIVQYITEVHGKGKLAFHAGDAKYAEYLQWFQFANGTLQSAIGRMMIIGRLGDEAQKHPMVGFVKGKIAHNYDMYERRLEKNKWLLGDDFTSADIMSIFSLTTFRGFIPQDLSPYPNILRYLQDIGARPGYQSAMKKGDPQIKPMLEANVGKFDFQGPPAKK